MTDAAADPRIAVALAALAEITDPADVGALVDATEIAPGVVDLHFSSTMPGYVDWRWTVSTAVVDGADPTVLEVQLLPGEQSLLAPPWVPWTDRLAEWRRSHPDEDAEAELDDASDDEDEDDEGLDDDDAVDGDPSDEDPLEAAGVEAEDVVVADAVGAGDLTDDTDDGDVDDVYGDSGEDDPADADADEDGDEGDDALDDDDAADLPFRPQRGGDRF